MSEKKPDPFRLLIDAHQDGVRRFTVTQDGRNGKLTTTTADGQTYAGPDGPNDAIHRFFSGAEPRNRRRDDAEPGGAA